MKLDTTFAELDSKEGIKPVSSFETGFPLEEWYKETSLIPIKELGVGDIARACRQNMHLPYVVERALEILDKEPNAGELYDGELVVALSSISPEFWSSNTNLTKRIMAIITLGWNSLDKDVKLEAESLLCKVGQQLPPESN